jgi:hypothetical protein
MLNIHKEVEITVDEVIEELASTTGIYFITIHNNIRLLHYIFSSTSSKNYIKT